MCLLSRILLSQHPLSPTCFTVQMLTGQVMWEGAATARQVGEILVSAHSHLDVLFPNLKSL